MHRIRTMEEKKTYAKRQIVLTCTLEKTILMTGTNASVTVYIQFFNALNS